MWTDVTELYRSSAAALTDSQLLASATFKYQTAMSAAELMDPKMDLGMKLVNKNIIRDRLESGELSTELKAEDVLAVLDKLFQLEGSWRSGNSLPQSLFVCMYVHEAGLQALCQRVGLPVFVTADAGIDLAAFPVGSRGHTLALALLAYCVACVKTCELERSLVWHANVLEEEDMVLETFGLNMLDGVTPKDAMLWLRDAETALLASVASLRPVAASPAAAAPAASTAAKKKKTKSKLSAVGVTVGVEAAPVNVSAFGAESPFPGVSTFAPICDDAAQAVALADALVARLHAKRCLLLAHLYMSLPQLRGLAEAAECLEVALELFPAIAATMSKDIDSELAEKAIPADPVLREKALHHAKINPPTSASSVLPGFDSGMAGVIIASNPPRFVQLTPYSGTLSAYHAMLEHLLAVVTMPGAVAPHASGGGVSFTRVCDRATYPDGRPVQPMDLTRVLAFQLALSRRNPNVIVRSKLWMLTGMNDLCFEGHTLTTLVQDCFAGMGVPGPCLTSEMGDFFFSRCGLVMHNILRANCRNRSRMMRKVKPILRDLNVLMSDAIDFDAYVVESRDMSVEEHGGRALHWITQHITTVLATFIEVALESEVFVDFDGKLAAYWQLEYLLVNLTRSISMVNMARATALQKAKAKKKAKKPAPPTPVTPSPDLILADAKRCLARANVRLLLSLHKLGLVPSSTYPLQDPAVQFGRRWELMAEVVRPTPLTYDVFLSSTKNAHASVYDLLEATSASFTDAKARCDMLIKDAAALAELPDGTKQFLTDAMKTAVSGNVFVWQLTKKLPPRPVPSDDGDDAAAGHGHSHGGVACGGHGHGHGHKQQHQSAKPAVPEEVPTLIEPVSVRLKPAVLHAFTAVEFL